MKRTLLAAMAVASILCLANSASAQHRGRSCPTASVYSYSTPYYSYRSYGPGTHVSRYAVRNHHAPQRSTNIYHYRVPNLHSHQYYHVHPHSHRIVPSHSYYRYGYSRSGVSLNFRF